MGIFTALAAISSPFRLAISMDVKQATLNFWKMREIFLNLGRALTLSFSFFFFSQEIYWPVFALFGGMTLLYPFLISKKLRTIH